MVTELSYKLEAFEGPLDLLLHLIEKDRVNIYDIPIAVITDQYLEYVAAMEEDSLDIKSDFLVMAATLLDIKARMLLPAEVDPETGEEVDPRAELVERLIEYKRCKLIASELSDMMWDADRALYRDPSVPKEVSEYEKPVDLDELLKGVDLAKLESVFNEVMKRRAYRVDPERSGFGTIKREKVSFGQKVTSLIDYTKKHRKFSFRNLLETQPGKAEVVVTFLAVLELTKAGLLHITQLSPDDDVEIETAGDGEFTIDPAVLEDFE